MEISSRYMNKQNPGIEYCIEKRDYVRKKLIKVVNSKELMESGVKGRLTGSVFSYVVFAFNLCLHATFLK